MSDCERCDDTGLIQKAGSLDLLDCPECTPKAPVAMTAQQVIEDREGSHGSYLHQATLSQELKLLMRSRSAGWAALSPEQRESLDMIAVKISRVLNGNPNTADHWTDMAGYATLISNLLNKGTYL